MLKPQDLEPGTSYACRFTVTAFLDDQGLPVNKLSLKIGEAHPGTPGTYESIGVVKTRDLDRELVELIDIKTNTTHVVAFANTWDYDLVEWI